MNTVTVFPNFAVMLGGAQQVATGKRFAVVTLADGRRIRAPLSMLPDPSQWTAFNLHDRAIGALASGRGKVLP